MTGPTIETAIWLALKSRVDTLSGTKLWPAERTTPAGEHIRVGRVVATPSRHLIANGKPHERTGFLMLTHCRPLNTISNVAQPTEAGGLIAAHFADGIKMRSHGICVSVPSYPQVMEGYEDEGWWFTVVRVPWRCFV